MNVTKVIAKDYENKSNGSLVENKANSNPNKPNFKGNHLSDIMIESRLIRYYNILRGGD